MRSHTQNPAWESFRGATRRSQVGHFHFGTLLNDVKASTLKNNGFLLRLSLSGMVRIIEFEFRCHSPAELVNTRCHCFDNSIGIGNGNIGNVLEKSVERISEIVIEKVVN